MKDVKLIRLITGEEIVAEVLDWNNGVLTVQNALVVIPQQGQIGFAPWATVIDPEQPEIGLDMKHVIYSVAVAPAVVEQYAKIFGSNIVLPEKQLIL
ncbi:hypothetical protein Sn250709_149 [Synechococcus phage S-RIM2]|jgi:hypothetical protein|uniref:Uncharacterized protein n=4 Tax=Nerrivikvirus srim2 TaxID=2734125 RepID=A0A1D7S6J3_9CAUD|nr:hypothetical protein SWTG_00119 [Synechococcus phage S-RIM2 R1_1999]AGH06829.1 hypothetical protein SWRG_00135 [Synechococcus phage S-RIM2 R21_2007]AGH07039.1 hypothetical protein SWUG_00130 [Synechococcus phage S-RIM2 R9_2006]AON97662.1 hypothetical protein Fa020709_149 [Synechococcus phage S-RIM2]AGH07250.1 hypothetical protein SWTG_00119 [Synechococcus phage S-RIM2 R1_1999]AON97876.1 hypothetical protein Fa100709_149 [Synechococcus phage S-RIM2]